MGDDTNAVCPVLSSARQRLPSLSSHRSRRAHPQRLLKNRLCGVGHSKPSTSRKGKPFRDRPGFATDTNITQCKKWKLGGRLFEEFLHLFRQVVFGSRSGCSLSTIRSQSSLTGMKNILDRKPTLYLHSKSSPTKIETSIRFRSTTCCGSVRFTFSLWHRQPNTF